MKLVIWIKIAAQLPFSFLAALSLSMSAYEILHGNFSDGVLYFSVAVFFGLTLWFAWKSPADTGAKLVFGGVLFLLFSILSPRTEKSLGGFLIGGAMLISGLLLLLADWATPKEPE